MPLTSDHTKNRAVFKNSECCWTPTDPNSWRGYKIVAAPDEALYINQGSSSLVGRRVYTT
ncbi:hypothetical protein PtB15_12B45 [Puccinia triticina]|nr:hypothetical protein PtB15_12B45 [Puccinia triticina]